MAMLMARVSSIKAEIPPRFIRQSSLPHRREQKILAAGVDDRILGLLLVFLADLWQAALDVAPYVTTFMVPSIECPLCAIR